MKSFADAGSAVIRNPVDYSSIASVYREAHSHSSSRGLSFPPVFPEESKILICPGLLPRIPHRCCCSRIKRLSTVTTTLDIKMPHAKAVVAGRIIAESDNYEVVEGNIYVCDLPWWPPTVA